MSGPIIPSSLGVREIESETRKVPHGKSDSVLPLRSQFPNASFLLGPDFLRFLPSQLLGTQLQGESAFHDAVFSLPAPIQAPCLVAHPCTRSAQASDSANSDQL